MNRQGLCIGLIVLFTQLAAAQENSRWPALTARVHALRHTLDSLEVALQSLDDSARLLSSDIAFLSSKDLLSNGERRQLTQLRRRAQLLTIKNQSLSRTHSRQTQQLQSAVNAVIHFTQQITDSLTRALPPDREALSLWQQERKQYQSMLPDENTHPGPWAVLFAHPQDTPRSLKLKGDWLLDREAALRREAEQVVHRLNDLNREARIRSRVADMDRELSLFSQNEELFARSTRQAEESNAQPASEADFNGTRENVENDGAALLDRPAMELTGPMPSSPQTLQAWIHRLTAYQSRLIQVADSLRTRADHFYTQSQNR